MKWSDCEGQNERKLVLCSSSRISIATRAVSSDSMHASPAGSVWDHTTSAKEREKFITRQPPRGGKDDYARKETTTTKSTATTAGTDTRRSPVNPSMGVLGLNIKAGTGEEGCRHHSRSFLSDSMALASATLTSSLSTCVESSATPSSVERCSSASFQAQAGARRSIASALAHAASDTAVSEKKEGNDIPPALTGRDADGPVASAGSPKKHVRFGTDMKASKIFMWTKSEEIFVLACAQSTTPAAVPDLLPVLQDRLYLARHEGVNLSKHFSSGVQTRIMKIHKSFAYRPFCADFGPINLGMTVHFCEVHIYNTIKIYESTYKHIPFKHSNLSLGWQQSVLPRSIIRPLVLNCPTHVGSLCQSAWKYRDILPKLSTNVWLICQRGRCHNCLVCIRFQFLCV